MSGNGNLIILTGKSGAGKDSVLKALEEYEFDTSAFVSTTTRPMRTGERDGVDYNFVSNEVFQKKAEAGDFIEYRSYNTKVNGNDDVWYYGSPKIELDKDKDYALVLDMQGAKDFVDYFGKEHCFVVYIDVPDQIREERAASRGSFDKTEWDRRVADDEIKFSKDIVDSIANYQIVNMYDLEDTVTDILYAYDEYAKQIGKSLGNDLIIINSTEYSYNNPPEDQYKAFDRESYSKMIDYEETVSDLPSVPNFSYLHNFSLEHEELCSLFNMGYDINNPEQALHDLIRDMSQQMSRGAEVQFSSQENLPFDISVIGYTINDNIPIALYRNNDDGMLYQAEIKHNGNNSYIEIDNKDENPVIYPFNKQDTQLYNVFNQDNVVAYFLNNSQTNDETSISIIKEDNSLAIMADGNIIREDIPSYATAVTYVAEMFPEAYQIDTNTLAVSDIVTTQDFKNWLSEKIGEMTFGEYTAKIYPAIDKSDVVSQYQLIDYLSKYAQLLANEEHFLDNFDEYVLKQIADKRRDDFFILEASISDCIIVEGLKDPNIARFIMDYSDGTDLGNISPLKTELLAFGGYKGWDVASEAFFDKDYSYTFHMATSNEVNSAPNAIYQSLDTEGMYSAIYNNQEMFEKVTDNALTYLIHQQGYTLDNVYTEMKSPDNALYPSPFIESIINEFKAASETQTTELGLSITINGKGSEFLQKLGDLARGYALEVNQEAFVGLTDVNTGKYIGQGIKLEQNAIIPSAMIQTIDAIDHTFNPFSVPYEPFPVSSFTSAEPSKLQNITFEDMNETRLNLKENILDTKYKQIIEKD